MFTLFIHEIEYNDVLIGCVCVFVSQPKKKKGCGPRVIFLKENKSCKSQIVMNLFTKICYDFVHLSYVPFFFLIDMYPFYLGV